MNKSSRVCTSALISKNELRPASTAERAQWIERFRLSGQCQRGFAEAHGLKLSQLRYWIYSPAPKAEGMNTAPRLQEVHLQDWPTPPSWSAEIALPAGPTIRLDASLARELIVPLVKAKL